MGRRAPGVDPVLALGGVAFSYEQGTPLYLLFESRAEARATGDWVSLIISLLSMLYMCSAMVRVPHRPPLPSLP